MENATTSASDVEVPAEPFTYTDLMKAYLLVSADLAAERARNSLYMAEIQRLRAGIGRLGVKFQELLEGGIKTAFEHK